MHILRKWTLRLSDVGKYSRPLSEPPGWGRRSSNSPHTLVLTALASEVLTPKRGQGRFPRGPREPCVPLFRLPETPHPGPAAPPHPHGQQLGSGSAHLSAPFCEDLARPPGPPGHPGSPPPQGPGPAPLCHMRPHVPGPSGQDGDASGHTGQGVSAATAPLGGNGEPRCRRHGRPHLRCPSSAPTRTSRASSARPASAAA